LPELLELQGMGPSGDATLIGYPALIDRDDAVELQVFDEPESAQREHRRGLRRLFAIALREPLKFFDRNVPEFQRLSMLFMPLGTADELKRDLVDALIDRACLGDPWPTDRAAFDERVLQARPRVTLVGSVTLGRRAIVHPGAVLGADGFGFAPDRDGWVKVPQLGGVRIGDDVEIGANTTIDRGAIGDTVVEDGVKLDNQIQVGHNVSIGRGTAIAAQVGISGSTRIGAGCLLAGQVGIAGHLEIADRVIVLGGTAVTSSIREAGEYSGLVPGIAAAKWRRTVARLHRIEDMHQRLKALEKTHNVGGATSDPDEREQT
jgi:acetyltransferase-like isoleucine patch superfamily enzyme